MSDVADHDADVLDYERLVSAMGDGLYAIDADGTLLDVNDTFVEMTGYDRDRVLADGPHLWYEPEAIERFEAAIRSFVEDPTRESATVEATLYPADGEELVVEVTMTPLMDDGRYEGHVGVIRDVTERWRREQDLAEYETIVRAMPDEVYTLDPEGRFTSIVPATGTETTMSGHDPAALLGEPASLVLPDEDVERGEALIRDLLRDPDREKASYEMSVVTRDGELIPVENHIALLPSADGEFRGTVGVLRDISERKAREEALERQNERLDEFADVVSHDLRNPLNVAMGHLELLREDYDDDRLEALSRAQERMAAIVDDVLALAREGERVRDWRSVELASVVDRAWASLEHDAATLDVDGDVTFRADGDRLQRLLENLLRNAIDHGGEDVSVTVEPIRDAGEPVGFAVADDGPGVPADEREAIFESGYSTAETGTGYGLAIVARIAEAHGWDVRVAESTDGGARFEVLGVEAG